MNAMMSGVTSWLRLSRIREAMKLNVSLAFLLKSALSRNSYRSRTSPPMVTTCASSAPYARGASVPTTASAVKAAEARYRTTFRIVFPSFGHQVDVAFAHTHLVLLNTGLKDSRSISCYDALAKETSVPVARGSRSANGRAYWSNNSYVRR